MKYYIYQHRRNDSNKIFYIGLGTKTQKDVLYNTFTRAQSKSNRNKYWKNIVNKHGFSFEIIFQFSSYDEAKLKEIELISFYGRKDINSRGVLVNMTDGGDGVTGIVFNDEIKRKISEKSKGNKHWEGKQHSQESKKRMSESRKKFLLTEKGIKQQKDLIEFNKKRAHKNGWKHTDETKEKNKIAHQKKCIQKTFDKQIVKVYSSIKDVENFGFNADLVIACCKGRKKFYKNYIWEYENTSNTNIH